MCDDVPWLIHMGHEMTLHILRHMTEWGMAFVRGWCDTLIRDDVPWLIDMWHEVTFESSCNGECVCVCVCVCVREREKERHDSFKWKTVRERKRDMTVLNGTQSSAMYERDLYTQRPIYTCKTNIKHKKQTSNTQKRTHPHATAGTQSSAVPRKRETHLHEKRHICLKKGRFALQEIYMHEKRSMCVKRDVYAWKETPVPRPSSLLPCLPHRSWQT